MSRLTGIQRTSGSELTTIRASWDLRWYIIIESSIWQASKGYFTALPPRRTIETTLIPAPLVLLIGLFAG